MKILRRPENSVYNSLIYKDLHRARRGYNLSLRKIDEKYQIQQTLSELLGHTSLYINQVYLKSLPSKVLDAYKERIVMI
ncbi:hypothetical protein [Leeuwenhoekiella marinoflava]|uniref:hypothetical protein n=1 Tax=Leeuwenhoekiella marinoflava TaxID=988 RepID=UPI0030031682